MTDLENGIIEHTHKDRVADLMNACCLFETRHNFRLVTRQRERLVNACLDNTEACKIIKDGKTYQYASVIFIHAGIWVWEHKLSLVQLVISVRECEGESLLWREAYMLKKLRYSPFYGPLFWCIEMPFFIFAFFVWVAFILSLIFLSAQVLVIIFQVALDVSIWIMQISFSLLRLSH